eukprot:1528411-Amphidinium_carterae.1
MGCLAFRFLDSSSAGTQSLAGNLDWSPQPAISIQKEPFAPLAKFQGRRPKCHCPLRTCTLASVGAAEVTCVLPKALAKSTHRGVSSLVLISCSFSTTTTKNNDDDYDKTTQKQALSNETVFWKHEAKM